MPPVPKPKRERTRHFFKEWREYRGLTQDQAIGRLGWSQSKISRIEAAQTPYNQDDLEAAAEAYRCNTVDLLTVNPFKDGEVVDLMRLLTEKNRDQAIRVLKALVQTG